MCRPFVSLAAAAALRSGVTGTISRVFRRGGQCFPSDQKLTSHRNIGVCRVPAGRPAGYYVVKHTCTSSNKAKANRMVPVDLPVPECLNHGNGPVDLESRCYAPPVEAVAILVASWELQSIP